LKVIDRVSIKLVPLAFTTPPAPLGEHWRLSARIARIVHQQHRSG